MTDRSDKLRDVTTLTCALLDGQIDDAGHRRLEELLFGDPEACELYLNLTTLHAHLIREHGGTVPVVGPPEGLSGDGVHRLVDAAVAGRGAATTGQGAAGLDAAAIDDDTIAPPPRRRWRLPGSGRSVGPIRLSSLPWRLAKFAAAASVVLVGGVAAMSAWKGANAEPAGACATLVEARDVDWAECGLPHAVGDRIVPSTVGLNRGTVVLRFDSGAVATLTGPVELLVEGRKSAELKRGSVLVRAERESAGFTLRTSASDYVDLGTEFGVAVNEDASSEVHVFEGVVIARPRASDLVVPVLRNEAGRVEADRGDLVAIESNAGRFPGVTTVPGGPGGAPVVNAVYTPGGAATPGFGNSGTGGRPPWAIPPEPANGSSNAGGSKVGGATSALIPPIHTNGPLPADARVVFLGERATDYEVHLLLIADAFSHLYLPGGPHPRLYNAGRTLPLAFAEADVRRFVLTFKPTHAVLEFGPELASGPHRISAGEFEADLRRLIDRLETDGIEPILSTGFKLGERQAQCQGVLDEYNRAVRRVAADHGYRLADVDAQFRSLEKYKLSLVASAGAVPTFGGYQQIAGALLSAMGQPPTKMATSLRLSMLPGVVTHWKYRTKPADVKLDDARASVLTMTPWPPADGTGVGDGWRELVLPQPDDKFLSRVGEVSHSATFRDRERGFATDLCKKEEQSLEAVAAIDSPDARPAYLNTGAGVKAAWVNGEKVFDSQGRKTGWHAGKERVPVRLSAGTNRIVIESSGCFFLSVTDAFDWPVQ